MKAWVYEPDREDGTGVFLYLEEVPDPEPGPGDVLIRVQKVSVCGTDEMLFAGKLGRAVAGIVPGHEFCGEIVEVGSEVENLRVGQLIAGESHYRRPGALGEGVIGLWPPPMPEGQAVEPVEGAYAEYVAIPGECAHPLPEVLADGTFWPSLFEPAGNDCLLARLVVEKARPRRVAVFGCGPHGLYAQIFLRHFGVEELVSFEIDPFRREFAAQLGFRCAMPGQGAGVEEFAGGPPDVCIDMVGKGGQAFEECCELVRSGGLVVLFGLFSRQSRIEIAGRRPNDIIFERLELPYRHGDKPLTLLGVTGREGIWPDLIKTVSQSPDLQEQLMRPVTVVGPLDLLGQEARRRRPEVLKRAFSAFTPKT